MSLDTGEFMRLALVVAACGLAVAGCTKDVRQVGATDTYVSPNPYLSHTCEELTEEASQVSSHLVKASGQDYTGDTVASVVGRVVFFPILVFEKDNYADPLTLARLKRSMELIEQASMQKNCGITFQRVSPPPRVSSNN